MKLFTFSVALALCLGLCSCATSPRTHEGHKSGATPPTVVHGQPPEAPVKLLRITANVDGSGRFVFSPEAVRYEHKHWSPPQEVTFDGEPWSDLDRSPSGWTELSKQLDLTRAWIVSRQGRDVIALETTPVGFDLYLCDSPNSSADYEVTIAIPRRN